MSDRVSVGGAPVERGWRDLLSDALDVFATSPPNENRANSAAAAVGHGHGHGHGQHAPRRSPGGGGLSATLGGRGAASTTRRPSPLMTLLSRARPDAQHLQLQEGGAANTSVTISAASPPPGAHWLIDSARTDTALDESPAPSPSFLNRSASASVSAQLRRGKAADVPSASPSPAASSSGESEAALNEAAARAAQAKLIASVAGAYVRGQLIPVISAAEPARSPMTPAATAEAQGEASAFGAAAACAECARAATSDGAVAACAWADALALDKSTETARAARLTRLRELSWSTPLSSTHRASVWLSLTIGDDPQLHAHWERYYTCVLASAAATAAPTPPPAAAAGAVGGGPSRSRAKFSSVAFSDLLKDVERTLPTFEFFSDARGRGVHVLQRLLTAFSLHRPLIGYCQSLNFVAALIALVCQGAAEHLAFALLCHVLEARLAYYGRSMIGCVMDARVLRDLVSFHEPDLSAVLARQDVQVEHFASSWLLCLFIHAPLALHQALRVWDLYLAQGETILFHTGLALFHVHRNAFTQLYKPSAEQLMNIVLKQIGSGTSLPSLLARVRTSFASNRSMGASVQALRQFHRAALAREQAVLSSSRLRRLERSTGVGGPELQRLWACFLQGEQRWPTLVSGVINDLVHFRIAFGEAVFPPHAPPPPGSAAAAPAGNGHQRQRSHSRLAMGGPTPLHESPRLWQGSGIVQATLAAADAAPCRLCVPPLPPLFHMDGETRPLQSCPRCTWLSDSASVSPGVTAAIESTRPTASSKDGALGLAPSHGQCTCGCTCISRVSGLGSSVFGRLFLLLDGRAGLHRGYLDFEDFVAGCKIFTASNRAQRLRAVFRMALSASADGRGDDAEQIHAHASGPADAGADASADQSESHVVRGRVSRAGFTALVALFEELYHGHSYIAQPVSAPSASAPGAPVQVQQPQPQIPASLPASWLPASPSGKKPTDDSAGSAASSSSSPALLLSSQASSRMFVDAMFEKAAADRQRRAIQRWERGEDLAEAFDPTAATGDLSPTGADGELDSLSYESFAHCIVLHPLISNFFRLDELAA